MIPLSPALFVAGANAYLGADERWDAPGPAALVHHVGFWSHYDALVEKSSWPLPDVDCAGLATFAFERGVLRPRPQLGDVFLVYSPNLGSFFHAGVVTSLVVGWGNKAFACETIESFEDGRVMRRSRQFGSDDRFIRWVSLDRRGRARAA